MIAVYLSALAVIVVLAGAGMSAIFHDVRNTELSGVLSIVASLIVGGGFGMLFAQLMHEAGYF